MEAFQDIVDISKYVSHDLCNPTAADRLADRIYSFDPIIDESSEVLILGTLPGPDSLRNSQYYANPNNQFWRIIYKAFDEESADHTYDEKMLFLLEHKLALWDIFHSAYRDGALDSDIKHGEPNDVPSLIKAYPGIKRILLAGKKAENSFRKHYPEIAIDTKYVPSTSPAYAAKSIDDKAKDWKSAIFIH